MNFSRGALLAAAVAVLGMNGAAAEDKGWVQGGEYRLFARTYPATFSARAPVLIVVLHGDSPFAPPDYQYAFAATVAAAHENVIAVALLRPGYADPDGNRSEGERGMTNGDNWNARNVDAIAAAIAELRARHAADHVVLVGHSGGAALAGNIAGRHPGLVDAALLVACPCGDLAAWRASMHELTGAPVFEGEIDSLTPIDVVENTEAKIALIVGSEDVVTPPRFSEAYREAARAAGVSVPLLQVSGQPHDMLFHQTVFETLAEMLAGL